MKRKSIVTIAAVLILTIASITAYAAQELSFFTKVGQADQQVKQKKNKADVVATVNEIPVEREYLDRMMNTLKFNNASEISEEAALDLIATNILLYEEAKKEKVDISVGEAKKLLKEQAESALSNEQTKKDFEDFLAGAGMTQDQYLNDKATIAAMQEFTSIANLRTKIESTSGIDPSNHQALREHFDEYVQTLKSKAKIKKVK